MDLDVVADEDAPRLQRLVPDETEVAAIDLAVGAEAHALATPRIASAAFVGRGQLHFTRRAADREIADHRELLPRLGARALDPLALEGDARMVGDVEEVAGDEVAVALLDARVDA